MEGLLKRARKPEKIAEYEAELAVPPFPVPLAYLWRAFWRLRRRKGAGMSGREPIEWADLVAYLALTKTTLTPWEIEVIEDLDDLYRAATPTIGGGEE
ncbi:hypothetical protein G6N73_04385 [Mesorhizobium camelthorni]|uniref:Tail assembly chaperone n=1 Tax=Allomesorhizobium camelthorni TaxID=475069 RepID=A0A6G4W794_9HYPH|nr:hypothetical protein [Mesorhizobium camelthorni]